MPMIQVPQEVFDQFTADLRTVDCYLELPDTNPAFELAAKPTLYAASTVRGIMYSVDAVQQEVTEISGEIDDLEDETTEQLDGFEDGDEDEQTDPEEEEL